MIAALKLFMMWMLGKFIARVVAAIGISTVTYIGINQAIDQVLIQFNSLVSALPPQVGQMAVLLQIPNAFSLMCSITLSVWSIKQANKVFLGSGS